MRIQLLYFAGCPMYLAARERLDEALREEGLESPVEMIEVRSQEEAESLRFVGSPSIRINGLDIDESARSSKNYGMMCRVYTTKSGMSGSPSKDTIRARIREAKATRTERGSA